MRDPSNYLDVGSHPRILLTVMVGAVGVCNEVASGQGPANSLANLKRCQGTEDDWQPL